MTTIKPLKISIGFEQGKLIAVLRDGTDVIQDQAFNTTPEFLRTHSGPMFGREIRRLKGAFPTESIDYTVSPGIECTPELYESFKAGVHEGIKLGSQPDRYMQMSQSMPAWYRRLNQE